MKYSKLHKVYDIYELFKSKEHDIDEEIDIEEDVLEEKVSNIGAFWNVCNSIQGVAILAMPYVIKTGGWWSIAGLCLISALSNYTGQVLVDSKYDYSESTDGQIRKVKARESYADIGEAVWGRFGKIVVLVMQVLELLFMATLYPIAAGSVLKELFPDSSAAWWIFAFGVMLLPNVFIGRLNHISLISALTIAASVIVFFVILFYCFFSNIAWDIGLLSNISGSKYPLAIGVITASYSSQMYLSVIETNMREPRNINTVMNWAYAVMTVLKVVIGVVGYLTFKSETDQVVTTNIPQGLVNTVVNIGVLLISLSSYSLPMFSIFDIVNSECQYLKIRTENDKEYQILIYCFRFLLYLSTILMAEIIPHFCLFLSVIGSVTGVCLEFIFPCVFHVMLHFDVLPKRVVFFNMVMIITSVLLVPVGVYFTGSALIAGFKSHGQDYWI